jgi:Resolvase, N terminal domain
VAYQRVSSLDQRVDRQLDGVTVDRTFTDTVSGKDTDRPELEAMLGFVRDGDTVIVHSMDRLARNLEDLRRIVRELTAKGVRVQFRTEQLTFTGEDTAMATFLLSVMGVTFADIWRSLLSLFGGSRLGVDGATSIRCGLAHEVLVEFLQRCGLRRIRPFALQHAGGPGALRITARFCSRTL